MTCQLYTIERAGKHFQVADYPGEKGTILALHGLTGTHKNFHHYAEALQGEYRFISIDLRGRGNSSGMDDVPSIFSHAQDVKDLIEHLAIQDPILLGHSMGAFISAIVASELDTVKGLILLDGAARMSERQQAIVKPSLGRLQKTYETKRAYVEEVKQIYGQLGIEWTDAVQAIVEYDIHEVDNLWVHKSFGQCIQEDFNSFYSFNPKEVLSAVNCSTLLVQATGNIGPFPSFFETQDFEEMIQATAKLVTYTSNCNHYTMMFTKQAAIIETIQTFLKEV